MTVGFSEFMQSLRSGFFDTFFNTISFLGEDYMYIVMFCILYFAINKRLGELMTLSLFASYVLNTTLKGLFMVDRPFVKYPDRIIEMRPVIGSSFPSAHTQGFTAFLFSGAFWLKKRMVYIGAGILCILMALSRVYLGMHWLEDVVASLVLGGVAAYFLHKFYVRHKEDAGWLIRFYLTILAVFLPFLIILGGEDLFIMYGLMFGFTFAMYLEKKYVNFTMHVPAWKKIIRVVIGVFFMVFVLIVAGKVFDKVAEEGTTLSHILGMVRYGSMVFVGLGCTPFIIKKFNL